MKSLTKSAVMAGLLAAMATFGGVRAELLAEGVTENSLAATPHKVLLRDQAIAYVPLVVRRGTPEATDLISSTFKRIRAVSKQNGLKVNGSPMEVSQQFQEPDGSWKLWAAIPIAKLPAGAVEGAGDIQFAILQGGPAAQMAHKGDHAKIGSAYVALFDFAAKSGGKVKGPYVEQHFDNPHTTPVEKQRSAVTLYLH